MKKTYKVITGKTIDQTFSKIHNDDTKIDLIRAIVSQGVKIPEQVFQDKIISYFLANKDYTRAIDACLATGRKTQAETYVERCKEQQVKEFNEQHPELSDLFI